MAIRDSICVTDGTKRMRLRVEHGYAIVGLEMRGMHTKRARELQRRIESNPWPYSRFELRAFLGHIHCRS